MGIRSWLGIDRLEHKIDHLIQRNAAMATQLEDLISAIDAETNAVAAEVDALHAQLAAAQGATVTQADLDRLAAIRDRLKTIGSDPANPVPAPPATPAA
jgi:hypothetical protein